MGATLAEIESEEESDAVLSHLYEIVAGEGVFHNDIWWGDLLAYVML